MVEKPSQGADFKIELNPDTEKEALKVKLWPTSRGFTYEVGYDPKGRIIQMSYGTTQVDGHVTRIFQVERVSAMKKHVVVRDPTALEMVCFYKVADHALPGSLLVEIMRGEIIPEIKKQASDFLSQMWAIQDKGKMEPYKKESDYLHGLLAQIAD